MLGLITDRSEEALSGTLLGPHRLEQEIGSAGCRSMKRVGRSGSIPPKRSPTHGSLNNYVLFRASRAGLRPLDIGLGGIAPLAGCVNNSDK